MSETADLWMLPLILVCSAVAFWLLADDDRPNQDAPVGDGGEGPARTTDDAG